MGGMLGIGGGVIIVPALITIYEHSTRFDSEHRLVVAVATSLACIIFTSASAAYTQYRAGMVRWDLFQRLVAFLLLGSFFAGWVAPALPTLAFQLFIGLFLAFVAVVMLSRWQPDARRAFPGYWGSAGIGVTGGMAAGLAGIAGGNVIVPTLIFFNTPVHNATATSSALGVPIALMGTLGYWFSAPILAASGTLGFVDLVAGIPIVIGALVAAPLGVKIAHQVPSARLKQAFGGLLMLIALRMLFNTIY